MNTRILRLLFSISTDYVIFFGYSPFQINLINKIRNSNEEFLNSKILLFDLNKSLNGQNQFKKTCHKFESFIEYNNLSTINLIQILILIKLRNINVIHGNYNSKTFKILSKIHSKHLFGLDDGSNSLLMPFRLENKFKKFFTIFPVLKECNNLKKYVDIVEIEKGFRNKTLSNKIKYNDVYICGSADVEQGLIKEEIYMNKVSVIINYLKNYSFKNIFYYPHRRESIFKLKKLEISCDDSQKVCFLKPLIPFDDYYAINNLKACVISLTSTLEKSLGFILDHNNFLIKPIRYSPNYIDQNYCLDYSIISSSLSSKFRREELLIFLNNQLINYIDFLSDTDLLKSSMIKIQHKQIIDIITFYFENRKIQKWKGQPILISDKFNIFRWNKILENYKLINYLQIAPELIIGHL